VKEFAAIFADIITLADAAELLGRSESTLRHQAQIGRFRAEKRGKTWLTTRSEVERYRHESLGQPGRPAKTP
jgi:excisionase family DNA binding protein